MANFRYDIDTYRIYHSNEDYAKIRGTVCTISCYAGTIYHGTLYFFRNNYPISGHSYQRGGKLGLFFRESQLADIINTLRYEKPLYIWYNDADHRGGLDTSYEPIGEEES